MVTQNSTILASDYNAIQTQVANVLGTGSATYGYGQAVTSGQKAQGNTINVTDWANLKLDILKLATHQGLTSNVNITPLSGLSITNTTTILAADVNKFSTAATTVDTNRFLLGATQFTTTQILTSQRTSQWGSPTKPTVTHSFTVTFTSADAARFFWNSGGFISFVASRSGGSGTLQNSSWDTLLSSMGTIKFNIQGTSATSGTTSTINWYSLTTADQTIFSKGGSTGLYATNNYTILARKNSTSNILYITVNFNDVHTNAYTDYVDGTLTSTVSGGYATESTPGTSVLFNTGSWSYANNILLSA